MGCPAWPLDWLNASLNDGLFSGRFNECGSKDILGATVSKER